MKFKMEKKEKTNKQKQNKTKTKQTNIKRNSKQVEKEIQIKHCLENVGF